MSTHGLELGSLDLASPIEHESGCKFSVLAEGTSFGSAQALIRSIVSMLADGDLVTYDRSGNREASFPVQIEAPDGVALAAGEVALRRELYRPNLVKWTPPADFGPATVFEVVMSEMAPAFDDIDELNRRRRFTVTLTCGPWARSADLTTVEALAPPPVTPVTVTVSTADTTTGWSTRAPATLGATGGYVYSTQIFALSGVATHYLSYAEATNPATPYLNVEWWATYVPVDRPPRFSTAPIVASVALAGGWTRTTYDTSGATYASMFFQHEVQGTGGQFRIRNIERTDTLPQVTARQVSRFIDVGGTERTPASIKVSAPDGTTSLGLTVAYTSPTTGTGNSPDMRRWRTQGNTVTTDTATFSGKREPIHPLSFEAQVPTSSLPEGGYQMVAMLRSSATGPVVIDYSTGTVPPDSGGVREGLFTGTTTVNFTAANTWQMVEIGDPLSLPTVRTAAGLVQIGLLRHTGETATIDLDEVWLFRVDDDCQLTIVDSSAPFLWLDSPTVDQPVPTVWMGSSFAARRHPGARLKAQGNHHLSPDGTTLFIASRNVDNPKGEATYYRRWHSNAAE